MKTLTFNWVLVLRTFFFKFCFSLNFCFLFRSAALFKFYAWEKVSHPSGILENIRLRKSSLLLILRSCFNHKCKMRWGETNGPLISVEASKKLCVLCGLEPNHRTCSLLTWNREKKTWEFKNTVVRCDSSRLRIGSAVWKSHASS